MNQPPRRLARQRPRRRRALLRVLALVAAGGLLFVLGVALGRATREHPVPGTSVTYVRTLQPRPIAPRRETVTVTVGDERSTESESFR